MLLLICMKELVVLLCVLFPDQISPDLYRGPDGLLRPVRGSGPNLGYQDRTCLFPPCRYEFYFNRLITRLSSVIRDVDSCSPSFDLNLSSMDRAWSASTPACHRPLAVRVMFTVRRSSSAVRRFRNPSFTMPSTTRLSVDCFTIMMSASSLSVWPPSRPPLLMRLKSFLFHCGTNRPTGRDRRSARTQAPMPGRANREGSFLGSDQSNEAGYP